MSNRLEKFIRTFDFDIWLFQKRPLPSLAIKNDYSACFYKHLLRRFEHRDTTKVVFCTVVNFIVE